MTSGDSSRTKKIFAYEERQYQNLLSLAKANNSKTKWLPINQYFKAPIENNLKMIDTEIKRINIASQMPSTDVGKLYRDTYNALGSGDYETAKVSYDKFKSTKPPQELINELEPRLQDAKSVMERLEKERKEAEILAKIKAEEERARLAKEKRDAARALLENNKDDEKENVLDKMKHKKDLEDRLSK
jgi:TolA-binding protein